MPIVIKILSVVHVLVSLLIILLVLMQRPKSEGLGAAFGGGMTDNLFGAQSTNVLQTITRWLGGLFFALALGLSLLAVKATEKNSIQQQLMKAAAVPKTPATTATPGTPTTPEGEMEKKLQEEIQKILEKQGTVPPPADGTPVTPALPALPALPEGTLPPAKPEAPAPEAAPAPVPVPDAKPAAPASVPAAPATPAKRPKTPPR